MIADYVGQTAIKTAEIVQRALGGVLFIDEAYELGKTSEGSFATECVTELVAAMTRYRDLCVILAGYTDEMDALLNSPDINPGLPRRFPNRWELRSYTGQELYDIFSQAVARDGYVLADDLQECLPQAFTHWVRGKDPKRFGNAGEVKDLVWQKVRSQARSLTIEREDFRGCRHGNCCWA
ncbi:hypothetical protein AGMMS50256_31490 [Betaproteobacteria bacterium]|nr:hypothetical protein AGMMS50256_31490 [Betaproteobacteria bacterium]